MAHTLHVVIDSREKKPVRLPAHLVALDSASRLTTYRVLTRSTQLSVGDYCLESPDPEKGIAGTSGSAIYATDKACVIERKATLPEIADNVLNPKRVTHFRRLLERMSTDFHHSMLVVEGGLSTLYPSHLRESIPVETVRDHLLRLSLTHRVPILFSDHSTPARRLHLADYILRYLLASTLTKPHTPTPPTPKDPTP